jgi:hypothetical protein
MSKAPSFNKIKTFVQDQVTDQTLLIRHQSNGFKVNNYLVRQADNSWEVLDIHGDLIHQFFSRKYAVLSAILLSKKHSSEVRHLKHLDQQLAIASEDEKYYNHMLRKETTETAESIYIARLSRAKQVLEGIRQQIHSLEKSLQLQ